MNIRTKLTLQFSTIVTGILLIFSIAVYFQNEHYREKTFYDRLQNKAITTSRLLFEVHRVDTALLSAIERNTVNALYDENIIIYNTAKKKIVYQNLKGSNYSLDQIVIDKILRDKEYKYRIGRIQVYGILYSFKDRQYVIVVSAYDKWGLAELSNLLLVILTGLFISLLVIVFAGLFFSRRALKPISEVVKQVESISASNLDLRVSAGNGKDEIALLARTFNNMLHRIESAFETQKRFVSNASHELRTPLTSITGQIEVILMSKRSEKEYEKVLRSVLEDIKNLNKLSNGLLELNQASIDISALKLEEVRVDELLLETQIDIVKKNTDYHIKIDFENAPDDDSKLLIIANENLLKIAFFNIIENACKFSPDHTASIIIRPLLNDIRIDFVDNGIGIPIEETDKIFNPFYRATNAANINGHGIGLSLVDKVISLHRGNIIMNSELGKGTTVTITLPMG